MRSMEDEKASDHLFIGNNFDDVPLHADEVISTASSSRHFSLSPQRAQAAAQAAAQATQAATQAAAQATQAAAQAAAQVTQAATQAQAAPRTQPAPQPALQAAQASPQTARETDPQRPGSMEELRQMAADFRQRVEQTHERLLNVLEENASMPSGNILPATKCVQWQRSMRRTEACSPGIMICPNHYLVSPQWDVQNHRQFFSRYRSLVAFN